MVAQRILLELLVVNIKGVIAELKSFINQTKDYKVPKIIVCKKFEWRKNMISISRNKLEEILQFNMPAIKGKEIWGWGVGSTMRLYSGAFKRLENEGLPILGFCDSNPEKQDNGIISPELLLKRKDICVLICSSQTWVIEEVSEQCKAAHVLCYPIDEALLKLHKKEVLQCYDLLEDERSKDLYANIIYSRIKRNYKDIKVDKEQYFALPPFNEISDNEVFIDCGAYVGDTIERYIWSRLGQFGKIVAFEPDQNNFAAMQKRVRRLKEEWNLPEDAIDLNPYGVGEKNEYGNFISVGGARIWF